MLYSLSTQDQWCARDTSGVGPAERGGSGGVAHWRLDVPTALKAPVRLWSAEQPSLYLLVLQLHDGKGHTLECEACQVSLLC